MKTEPEFRLTTATAMASTTRILRSMEPGAHLARCQGKAPAGTDWQSRQPRRRQYRPLRKRAGVTVAESQRPWEPPIALTPQADHTIAAAVQGITVVPSV